LSGKVFNLDFSVGFGGLLEKSTTTKTSCEHKQWGIELVGGAATAQGSARRGKRMVKSFAQQAKSMGTA
jgi:hypothetical protein